MIDETQQLREKLAALRTELVDLAFTLECRGRLDAADLAIMLSTRVSELCAASPVAPVIGELPERIRA